MHCLQNRAAMPDEKVIINYRHFAETLTSCRPNGISSFFPLPFPSFCNSIPAYSVPAPSRSRPIPPLFLSLPSFFCPPRAGLDPPLVCQFFGLISLFRFGQSPPCRTAIWGTFWHYVELLYSITSPFPFSSPNPHPSPYVTVLLCPRESAACFAHSRASGTVGLFCRQSGLEEAGKGGGGGMLKILKLDKYGSYPHAFTCVLHFPYPNTFLLYSNFILFFLHYHLQTFPFSFPFPSFLPFFFLSILLFFSF